MKKALFALTALLALGAAQAQDMTLQQAVAAPHRMVGNVARDGARHPAETLAFFGIKPEHTVAELVPGGGWYTEILGPYLRAKGRLIEAGADADNPRQRGAYERFKAKLDALPGVYGKVTLSAFDVDAGKLDIAQPGSVDVVLTFRNVHNWVPLGEDKTRAAFAAMFKALKSGGTLGIVEHRQPATREAAPNTGYLHESYVIKMAESVGFKLVAKSEINANPKDKADHENGVWALPPTYTNKDKDRARYEAIGESDRMTLKFVKP